MAELDELKSKSENVLACTRVRDSTLTLNGVTTANFLRKTAMIAREWLGARDDFRNWLVTAL